LRSIPGVTENNVFTIMNSCKNLAEFSTQSKEELEEKLGSKPGALIWKYLNEEHQNGAKDKKSTNGNWFQKKKKK
jgi:hypothetical protein